MDMLLNVLTKIENTAEPLVLVCNQSYILFQAHNTSI